MPITEKEALELYRRNHFRIRQDMAIYGTAFVDTETGEVVDPRMVEVDLDEVNPKQENAMKAEKYIPNASAEVPPVKNYSQCKRAALALLGPTARVWRGKEETEPRVMVGLEQNPGRLVLGFGDDWETALRKAVESHNG